MKKDAKYNGTMVLNPLFKNNSRDDETEKKYPQTIIYYTAWINEIYGWLILLDNTFKMREDFEKKINQLTELYMDSLDVKYNVRIKDIFIYMDLARNKGNERNGKPMIFADIILSNRLSPEKPIKSTLSLNTMGTINNLPIEVSSFDIKDKTLQGKYPELVYSFFTYRLVNPNSRLLDLKKTL